MAFRKLIERTIYVAQCQCGEKFTRDENPPRETQCKCGKWIAYEEQSWTGPDIG